MQLSCCIIEKNTLVHGPQWANQPNSGVKASKVFDRDQRRPKKLKQTTQRTWNLHVFSFLTKIFRCYFRFDRFERCAVLTKAFTSKVIFWKESFHEKKINNLARPSRDKRFSLSGKFEFCVKLPLKNQITTGVLNLLHAKEPPQSYRGFSLSTTSTTCSWNGHL